MSSRDSTDGAATRIRIMRHCHLVAGANPIVATHATGHIDYAAGLRAGRLEVCECRIFQFPSDPFSRTGVSIPLESICRSPILALMGYSDVAYAD